VIYININGDQYPAKVRGFVRDPNWNNRDSKEITLSMTYENALAIFVDDVDWEIVYQAKSYTNEDGETITPDPAIYDNSDWCLAGPITDNRDGTVTVKMGKITAEEALAELLEVLA